MKYWNAVTAGEIRHRDRTASPKRRVGGSPMQNSVSRRALQVILGLLVISLVTGCASLSTDGGFGAVKNIAKERIGSEPLWPRTDVEREAIQKTVRQILADPLSVDDAVHIALINNPGLQATYADLGIAETDLVEASWPRNPGFSFSHLQGGGDKEIER